MPTEPTLYINSTKNRDFDGIKEFLAGIKSTVIDPRKSVGWLPARDRKFLRKAIRRRHQRRRVQGAPPGPRAQGARGRAAGRRRGRGPRRPAPAALRARALGRPAQPPPARRAAAIAVIENPFADTYQEDLEALMAIGEELGSLLGDKCVAALGVAPQAVHS